ncbi:MAG TPA: GNAT family N-acetyltransferase [Humibacter sp.]|nr:GNAT family N-acetyltransferase [Humibacter sp.]
MVTFVSTPVDDPVAQGMLAEYFAERDATFPHTGAYRAVFPDPPRFRPPAGDFVIGYDDETEIGLGCGGVRRIDDEQAGDAGPLARFEIKHLWVRPDARGRGLGRLLLGELETRAARMGARIAVLDTNESLEAAGALYRSAGYAAVDPYNDNPNATHWFRKVLPVAS